VLGASHDHNEITKKLTQTIFKENIMSEEIQFEKQSLIPGTLDSVWGFHAQPGAFRQLTPPPIIGQIHRDERESLTQGALEFTLWFGPFPVRWVASHEPGPSKTSFSDRMVRGPLATWVHTHIMEETPQGIRLADRILYTHKSGWQGLMSRLLFSRPALSVMFWYRHWVTRRAVALMPHVQAPPLPAEPKAEKNG
jgi:ligand-binding SRPBCC domain-containing protein